MSNCHSLQDGNVVMILMVFITKKTPTRGPNASKGIEGFKHHFQRNQKGFLNQENHDIQVDLPTEGRILHQVCVAGNDCQKTRSNLPLQIGNKRSW